MESKLSFFKISFLPIPRSLKVASTVLSSRKKSSFSNLYKIPTEKQENSKDLLSYISPIKSVNPTPQLSPKSTDRKPLCSIQNTPPSKSPNLLKNPKKNPLFLTSINEKEVKFKQSVKQYAKTVLQLIKNGKSLSQALMSRSQTIKTLAGQQDKLDQYVANVLLLAEEIGTIRVGDHIPEYLIKSLEYLANLILLDSPVISNAENLQEAESLITKAISKCSAKLFSVTNKQEIRKVSPITHQMISVCKALMSILPSKKVVNLSKKNEEIWEEFLDFTVNPGMTAKKMQKLAEDIKHGLVSEGNC